MFTLRLIASAALLTLALTPATAIAQGPVAAPVRTVDLQSYSYAPTPIQLAAGKAVTLQFVNRSGSGHDFTAKEFFAAARIVSGRVHDGEVELRPGQAKTVTLIPAAGTYKVHCGHPFHSMLGMKSTIIVR